MTKEFAILKDLKETIILDCGNGVAGIALTKIIENLGIEGHPLIL